MNKDFYSGIPKNELYSFEIENGDTLVSNDGIVFEEMTESGNPFSMRLIIHGLHDAVAYEVGGVNKIDEQTYDFICRPSMALRDDGNTFIYRLKTDLENKNVHYFGITSEELKPYLNTKEGKNFLLTDDEMEY